MDLFSFVKNNVEIVSIISEYTNLKKTGSMYWKGLCPFHNEKTPSFTVSPHKKIFYCFGCHMTGDVIHFIEKIENISTFEAVQNLIQRENLDVPKELETTTNIKADQSSYQLCQVVGQWCNDKLLKSRQALTYIKDRHITSTTVSQFTLGFFPTGTKAIQELISCILNKGFSTQDLINEHILFQKKDLLFSPFENRIMFPIKDHLGQTCGFGGRVFKPNDQRPKYYNSKETPYFKKGKILFGFDLAKQTIQKQQTAFIVEGYTDCIAMFQHGYKNSVATLGTSCTIDHLKQLSKHAQTIYVLYDADAAGKQAILRLTDSCWQLDIELKVVLLPQDQDPASMLEQNISLESYITQAIDIFTFFLQSNGKKFTQHTIREKLHAINDLLNLIGNIKDSLKRNILLIQASEIMQIPLDILKKEYNNKNKAAQQKTTEHNISEQAISPDDILEQQILATILHDPTIINKQHKTLLLAKVSEQVKTILKKIIDHASEGPVEIEHVLNPKELQFAQKALFTIDSSNIKQTFLNLIQQFQKKHWKSITTHIKMKLIQAKKNNNIEETRELLEIFEKLKQDIYKNGRL